MSEREIILELYRGSQACVQGGGPDDIEATVLLKMVRADEHRAKVWSFAAALDAIYLLLTEISS